MEKHHHAIRNISVAAPLYLQMHLHNLSTISPLYLQYLCTISPLLPLHLIIMSSMVSLYLHCISMKYPYEILVLYLYIHILVVSFTHGLHPAPAFPAKNRCPGVRVATYAAERRRTPGQHRLRHLGAPSDTHRRPTRRGQFCGVRAPQPAASRDVATGLFSMG